MVFRQLLERADYENTLIWELIIGEDYNELFAGEGENTEVKDVDIFEFESVKYDAEDSELRQKEDELSITMNEAAIRSEDDASACQLMRLSHTKDVWTALFLCDKSDFPAESRLAKNLIFSGLVRKSASADDLLWNGDDWASATDPLRTWKFKSQSFGEAVLDNVNLASVKVGENIIPGLLDQVDLSGQVFNVNIADAILIPKANGTYEKEHSEFTKGVHLNSLLRWLIEKTIERKREKIPNFDIETVESLTGYIFGRKNYGETQIKSFKFRLFANDEADETAGIHIDSRLVKPEMEDDGITPRADYKVSWHRFKSLTDLLYSLASFFGNQLRIKTVGRGKIRLEFVQLTNNYGRNVEIMDAVSGQINIFELEKRQARYAAKATDINGEGNEMNEINGTPPDHYPVRFFPVTKLPEAEKLLPLSISETWQGYRTESPVHPNLPWLRLVHQNCLTYRKAIVPYEMAWTGIMAGEDSDVPVLAIINRVASTIGKKGKWHFGIGDCINQRIKDKKEETGRNYQVEVPFINAVRSGRGTGIKNVQLFDRVTLDGENYLITSIEINPMDGKVKLKLTSANQYQIADDPTEENETGGGSGGGGGGSQDTGPVATPIMVYEADEDMNAGDLIYLDFEARLFKKYKNISSLYGRFVGVAEKTVKKGELVAAKTSGNVKDETLVLTSGNVVFARMKADGSKCVPSSQRLNARSEREQIDIEIGTAKSQTEWELKLPAKECEIM